MGSRVFQRAVSVPNLPSSVPKTSPVEPVRLAAKSEEPLRSGSQRSVLVDVSLGFASCCLMTLSNVFINLSRNEEGTFDFNPRVAVMIQEALKVLVSAVLLLATSRPTLRDIKVQEALLFAVPAALFMVNNTLLFYVKIYVLPALAPVLGNLKIVSTALCSRFFLKRVLTDLQWIAVALLLIGVMMAQYVPGTGFDISATGLLLVLIMATISGFAGVYTEFLLKKDGVKQSIHMQNLQLYIFGVLFNYLNSLYSISAGAPDAGDDALASPSVSLLHGFNLWTWGSVLANSINGLAISAVVKRFDTLVKVYISVASILLNSVLSSMLFDFVPNICFAAGVGLVALSVVLYSSKTYEALPHVLQAVLPDPQSGRLGSHRRLRRRGHTRVGSSGQLILI